MWLGLNNWLLNAKVKKQEVVIVPTKSPKDPAMQILNAPQNTKQIVNLLELISCIKVKNVKLNNLNFIAAKGVLGLSLYSDQLPPLYEYLNKFSMQRYYPKLINIGNIIFKDKDAVISADSPPQTRIYNQLRQQNALKVTRNSNGQYECLVDLSFGSSK